MDPVPTQRHRNRGPDILGRRGRSSFSHYLPRLRREHYRGNAVVIWTMPMANRASGWLDERFHAAFREMMLHAATREHLLCPAYCLMPDHIHHVWMGLAPASDQRNAIRFLRAQLSPRLRDAAFQHQAHDHVLRGEEGHPIGVARVCVEYVLANPVQAELAADARSWPFTGAVVPGYPRVDVFGPGYWEWYWKRHRELEDPACRTESRPPRQME